jgi:hypothetical protein
VSAATPTTFGSHLNDPERVELAESMLAETREEISRADGKASTLLAGAGIGMGALLAGLIAGDWAPSELRNAVEWLWWVGILVAAYGAWHLARCILPVVANGEHPNRIDYYGDITRFASADAFAVALAAGPADLYGRIVRQLYVNADIVAKKYRHLRVALISFGVGIGFTTAAVLVDLLW